MKTALTVVDYIPEFQPSIHTILMKIGWAEQYIVAMEQNATLYSKDKENYGVYAALSGERVVGFLYVQYYAWNQLCQIQGLAVDPEFQRQGIASALVARAEDFAKTKRARGIYVDTPTLNSGGRKFYEAVEYQFGYIMPRYYEDTLDGVTYQKFFDALIEA
ncbi:MAG TPA: GNAT family N-acetyltransferase [Anaerolineales bacterium]|nr:GNAT family N-acetyltransferase [Anaerolineales bacterium]